MVRYSDYPHMENPLKCVALLGELLLMLVLAITPSVRAVDDDVLTPKERLGVFEQVWKEINNYYYDPTFKGIDWPAVRKKYLPQLDTVKTDQEFYVLLARMAGELRDSHTRVLGPALLAQLQSQRRPGIGVSVEEVEGKPVITSVIEESEAARAGIEPGMVVLAIADQPALERLAEVRKTMAPSSSPRLDETRVYATTFGGPEGSSLKLTLQRPDGSRLEASLTRQLQSITPRFLSRRLPSGVWYVAFDQFTPETARQFKAALQNDAPGLIIDLRANSGGSSQALYPTASSLLNAKTLFLRNTTRTGKQLPDSPPLEVSLGEEGGQLYAGRVAILVGPRSASTAELFAAAMQDSKRAVVIGRQSCGCAVGINKQRKLKGGGILEIGEVLWLTPSGKKIEGEGVMPDQLVWPTIDDVRNRRDPLIAAAERVLR